VDPRRISPPASKITKNYHFFQNFYFSLGLPSFPVVVPLAQAAEEGGDLSMDFNASSTLNFLRDTEPLEIVEKLLLIRRRRRISV
jgi:hypothetical protein